MDISAKLASVQVVDTDESSKCTFSLSFQFPPPQIKTKMSTFEKSCQSLSHSGIAQPSEEECEKLYPVPGYFLTTWNVLQNLQVFL